MGDPGAGAEDQASRRSRRMERLRNEEARGEDVDGAMLQRALADQRAWSAGAEGERQVAEVLARMQRYGWTAIHDVRWPGRPQANIDHIAIGPGGVVVIDAKNWSGAVVVRDGVLRQNGYQRERQLEGVAQAAAAVTALLSPEHRTATRAVLCLTSQEQQPQAAALTGVDVVGRWQLPELLLDLPPRLSVYEAADIARFLTRELDRPASPRRAPRSPRASRAPRAPRTSRSGASRRQRPAARSATRPRAGGCLAGVVRFLAVFLGFVVLYTLVMQVLFPMLARSGQ